jgi:small subunit ribosomal protein S20
VYELANSRQAGKRIKITAKKTLRNKMIKTRVKNVIKNVLTAVSSKDKAASAIALRDATKVIDKAATKGVLHKNNASRKKSRLTKLVNKNI